MNAAYERGDNRAGRMAAIEFADGRDSPHGVRLLQKYVSELPFLDKTSTMTGMSGVLPTHAGALARAAVTGAGGVERVLRVGPFINLAAILRSLACDPEPVFRAGGFRPEQFEDPDRRLPYVQTSQLLARCVEATGCEHFGLLLGQSAAASHLGLTGFLARAAPNVERALGSLIEHLDLHDEGGTPVVTTAGNLTLLGYTVHQPGVAAIEQIYDMTTAVAFNIMRALCGEAWRPAEVLLSRRKPRDLAPYRRFFGTSIQFDAEMSAIVFPSHWLQHSVSSADDLLFKHLEKEAIEKHGLQHLGLAEALKAQLRSGLLQRKWAASEMASALGLHERTLHRRLRTARTSFRRELDAVRQSLSLQLLAGTGMTVAQITESMGYASSSAFIRAFRRWTGTTPMDWRKHAATSTCTTK
jgi:AraC-like DNA-binding protein